MKRSFDSVVLITSNISEIVKIVAKLVIKLVENVKRVYQHKDFIDKINVKKPPTEKGPIPHCIFQIHHRHFLFLHFAPRLKLALVAQLPLRENKNTNSVEKT